MAHTDAHKPYAVRKAEGDARIFRDPSDRQYMRDETRRRRRRAAQMMRTVSPADVDNLTFPVWKFDCYSMPSW